MKKVLKWILIGLVLAVVLFAAFIVSLVVQTVEYYSSEDVYGEVVLLKEGDIRVGDQVPMVFVVPEEYSDLHREMWECVIEKNGERSARYEDVLESIDMQESYTKSEIEGMFSVSPIDIYADEIEDSIYADEGESSPYTSKMAVFIPKESGTYHIIVAGYYRSTSPSDYGTIELTVYDE